MTDQELADRLCPIPRDLTSEHENDRLIHRDLDGCTQSQAWAQLVPALVSQQLVYDPWRAERIQRLYAVASRRARKQT